MKYKIVRVSDTFTARTYGVEVGMVGEKDVCHPVREDEFGLHVENGEYVYAFSCERLYERELDRLSKGASGFKFVVLVEEEVVQYVRSDSH